MLRIPETEVEFRNALIDAAEVGAAKALMDVGLLRPYLRLREAYRMHGEGVVKKWIEEGLIHKIKDGDSTSRVRIDRIELLAIAKASNRSSYLRTEELNNLKLKQKP